MHDHRSHIEYFTLETDARNSGDLRVQITLIGAHHLIFYKLAIFLTVVIS